MNYFLAILSKPENYEKNFEKISSLRLTCPYCGNLSKGHGYYTRYYRNLKIKIKRFYCKNCRKTWSLLPFFCIPRSRLDAKEVHSVVRQVILEGKTMNCAIQSVEGRVFLWVIKARERTIRRIMRALGVKEGREGKILLLSAERFSQLLFNTERFAISLIYWAEKMSNITWYVKCRKKVPKRDCDGERTKIFASVEPENGIMQSLNALLEWFRGDFEPPPHQKQRRNNGLQTLPRNAKRKPNSRKDRCGYALRTIQKLLQSSKAVEDG